VSWLATSPHGPQPNASWKCVDCPEQGPDNPLGASYDIMRQAAIAHLERTGHRVSAACGTLEIFYPMAATAKDTR
jgi:hypothetical protein